MWRKHGLHNKKHGVQPSWKETYKVATILDLKIISLLLFRKTFHKSLENLLSNFSLNDDETSKSTPLPGDSDSDAVPLPQQQNYIHKKFLKNFNNLPYQEIILERKTRKITRKYELRFDWRLFMCSGRRYSFARSPLCDWELSCISFECFWLHYKSKRPSMSFDCTALSYIDWTKHEFCNKHYKRKDCSDHS